MQTFFIPMMEQDLIDQALKRVSTTAVGGRFMTMLAFSITTDYTIIWYDHQEEGYEIDILNPYQPATQIWGDMNAANGCSPMVTTCTNENDVLMAGQTLQIANFVDVSPRGTKLYFDGGDKVFASYPITVTRAGYSERPGSVLAGGVEVYDTEAWGTEYISPVGMTMRNNQMKEAFEISTAFITAKEQTQIIIDGDDTKPYYLGPGKSRCFNVTHQGMRFSASAKIQVSMVTGDVNSVYELRWFSLNPLDQWTNDYVTPVGDSVGKTKLVLYNADPINNVIATLQTLNTAKAVVNVSLTIPPESSIYSPIIPFNSGGRIFSPVGQNFIAWSYTDTEDSGNTYDWGFPLVPTNKLTPQVVIGLGYGCTANDCKGMTARSPVWVTPTEDAFVFIDYTNSGNITACEIQKIKKLESIRIRASNAKKDMSGALIFATKWDGNPLSEPNINAAPVDIASAWGQDASVSGPSQEISMDLGTVTVPFTTIRVTKKADADSVVPGSNLMYTIRVVNVGQTNVPANTFKIVDPELDSATYIVGSTKYSTDGGVSSMNVPDDKIGTPFPLDGEGLMNLFEMKRRGGAHEISFTVKVEPTQLTKSSIVNSGWVDEPGRPNQHFTCVTQLTFLPSVTITNAVYLGQDDGASCGSRAVEEVGGTFGSDVTYCFTITNTGNTLLQIDVSNTDILYSYKRPGVVPPGVSFNLAVPRSISKTFINNALAIGVPLYDNGTPIPYMSPVQSTDPSKVTLSVPLPKIAINNTVLVGNNPAIQQSCLFGGNDSIVVPQFTDVTYCLQIVNTGNTYLGNVETKDPVLNNFINKMVLSSGGPLAPGAKYTMAVPMKVDADLINTATVTATPVLVTGVPIPGVEPVRASDDSKVKAVIIDVRSGVKDPFVPPPLPGTNGTITKCMLPHWLDSGKKSGLTCTAKEVYLQNIKNRVRTTCSKGTKVKVDISADVIFNSARYDPAFFVATDGGDAMTGVCLLKAFEKGPAYKVVDPDNNATIVGSVTFDNDFRGGNDKCGDIVINGGGGGAIRTSIISTEVQCTDRNGDGSLDIAVCFSWRVRGTDDVCTLSNSDTQTQGSLADVFPGTPSKCYCFVYEIDDISVDPVADAVDVCI